VKKRSEIPEPATEQIPKRRVSPIEPRQLATTGGVQNQAWLYNKKKHELKVSGIVPQQRLLPPGHHPEYEEKEAKTSPPSQ